jgi:UDP-N-acetylmuramoylalanine--D-glutamate ligase
LSAPRTLVLGLGRQGGGVPTVRYLVEQLGVRVRVSDRADASSLAAPLAELADVDPRAIEWRLGPEHEAAPDRLLTGCDRVVANPAIPDDHPVLVRAAADRIPVTQELDLALAAFPGRVVLVTGTNGKSTVATLLARTLRLAGSDTLLAGNIGRSLLADATRWSPHTTAVVEASSYQLARLGRGPWRSVAGTVLTRLGSDHLERHGSLAAYHAAKARALEPAQRFVARFADDAVARSFPTPPGIVAFEAAEADASARTEANRVVVTPEGRVLLGERTLAYTDAVSRAAGPFFVANAALAAAAALALDVPAHTVGLALATAEPLPFRFQELTPPLRLGAVTLHVHDNSVSTQIDSTTSALRALAARDDAVWWVAGGRSKEPDFARFARLAVDAAGSHLRGVATFGADARAIADALKALGVSCTEHVDVRDALDIAATRALASGASGRRSLLFSPACASFDQWPNFRARAEAFHDWFADRRRTAPANPTDDRERGCSSTART